MRIKLFEEFRSPLPIDIGLQGGQISGVIHYSRQNLNNWLSQEKVDDEVQGFFNMMPDVLLLPIAILKNMNVNEDSRNKGIGGKLMSIFLENASDAKNVVLIADTGESNGFDLVKWYEGWGFNKIGESGGMPVMVLNNY